MSTENKLSLTCEPFGTTVLRIPESMLATANGQAILTRIHQTWSTILDCTGELIEQVTDTIVDFNADFGTNNFEIQIFDDRTWLDVNSVMLRVQFFDEQKNPITPIFDLTIKEDEITHAQPCF